MLTTEQHFELAKNAGMTHPLSWKPSAGGDVQSADVIFRAPTLDVLGGGALSTDYTIEYPATRLAGLKRDELVTIEGVKYAVREGPRNKEAPADGSVLEAKLARKGAA